MASFKKEKTQLQIYSKVTGIIESPVLCFLAAYEEQKRDANVGFVSRIYDITALQLLIDPLYKDMKGISFWVYSSFWDVEI